MKRLDRLVTINLLLAFISVLALILQYFALCDIANEPESILEWRIVGICMMILAVFVISTFTTLLVFLKRHKVPDNSVQSSQKLSYDPVQK